MIHTWLWSSVILSNILNAYIHNAYHQYFGVALWCKHLAVYPWLQAWNYNIMTVSFSRFWNSIICNRKFLPSYFFLVCSELVQLFLVRGTTTLFNYVLWHSNLWLEWTPYCAVMYVCYFSKVTNHRCIKTANYDKRSWVSIWQPQKQNKNLKLWRTIFVVNIFEISVIRA